MQAKNTNDPFRLFSEWYAEAKATHPAPQDTAMSLATVAADSKPSVRIVLMKKFDEKGVVFYTNLESRKAVELSENPQAAIALYWPVTRKQVRIEGTVTQVSDSEADAYFGTRPRESQLAAWASKQSKILASHDELMLRYEGFRESYEGKHIPRPPFWSGFRLTPARFEFWLGHEYRLNERILFRLEDGKWVKELLYP